MNRAPCTNHACDNCVICRHGICCATVTSSTPVGATASLSISSLSILRTANSEDEQTGLRMLALRQLLTVDAVPVQVVGRTVQERYVPREPLALAASTRSDPFDVRDAVRNDPIPQEVRR